MVDVKLIEVVKASKYSKRTWYQLGEYWFVFDTEGKTGIPTYLLAQHRDTTMTIRKDDAEVVNNVPAKILCRLLALYYTILPIKKWWKNKRLKVRGV